MIESLTSTIVIEIPARTDILNIQSFRVEYRYILNLRWNIFRGRRLRKIFSTEGAIYAGISQGRVLFIT